MHPHETPGCSDAMSYRGRPLIALLLLALAAGAAWFLRSRHVTGIAESDSWREHLPEWSGPTGTSAEPSARRAPSPAPVALAAPAPAAPAPAAPVPAAPAPAAPDDLRRVEGIGPKIATALVAAELGTFAAVADASEGDLRAALKEAGLRFAPSLPTWARQARLLAGGDEQGFLDLTERLVAGRDEG